MDIYNTKHFVSPWYSPCKHFLSLFYRWEKVALKMKLLISAYFAPETWNPWQYKAVLRHMNLESS